MYLVTWVTYRPHKLLFSSEASCAPIIDSLLFLHPCICQSNMTQITAFFAQPFDYMWELYFDNDFVREDSAFSLSLYYSIKLKCSCALTAKMLYDLNNTQTIEITR